MTATLLVGCGNKKKEVTTDQGKSSESTQSTGSRRGDTLELAITTGDGSSTDDKIPTPWYNRNMATNLMFRSLFIADSSLEHVQPDLAEGYTLSEDQMEYEITLKEGLKWSDGEPLTSDDVVFSIETAQKTATINSIYTAAFGNIETLTTEGNVIKIKMKTPYADMQKVLGQFAILPKHSLENADPLALDTDKFWVSPVTSGMYSLDEFKVGNYFSLKLNDQYEGAKPQIEKVIVYFVTDFITAAQAGTVDYVFGNGADFVESMNGLTNYTAHDINVLFYKYFIFNMKGIDGNKNEAMDNIVVRKAMIEAIDRSTLASLYPNATVLNSGVPNDQEAYNGFEYPYDVEKAKQEIATSGYDLSKPLRICYYNNDQTSIDLINTVVYYLEQVGFTVESTLSNDGTTDLFTTRNYDIGFKGKSAFSVNEWYTEYMSTDALFSNIFGGDTAFDEEIAKLTATSDEGEQKQILKKLQELEQEKVYKVPVFTVGTMAYTSDKVTLPQGVEFCNPLYNCDVDFANWTVKP